MAKRILHRVRRSFPLSDFREGDVTYKTVREIYWCGREKDISTNDAPLTLKQMQKRNREEAKPIGLCKRCEKEFAQYSRNLRGWG